MSAVQVIETMVPRRDYIQIVAENRKLKRQVFALEASLATTRVDRTRMQRGSGKSKMLKQRDDYAVLRRVK